MNLATFRVRFPEFVKAVDTLVQACLDEAATETAADAWGTSYDAAHGLLAAHKLACSPNGTNARLEAGKETTYMQELVKMRLRKVDAWIVS